MDGHYVQNLGLSSETVKKVCAEKFIKSRVHLMAYDPLKYISNYEGCFPEEVYIHFHSTLHLLEFVSNMEKSGIKKGLAISPSTDFRETYKALEYFDEILFMGVEPGSGGQKFLDEVFFNIQDFVLNCPTEKDCNLSKIKIGADGGVNEDNFELLKKMGVSNFIVGKAYLESKDKKDFIKRIKN
jgi:ribulose-phosphate 3-epimerase